jgi:hypothetical protein
VVKSSLRAELMGRGRVGNQEEHPALKRGKSKPHGQGLIRGPCETPPFLGLPPHLSASACFSAAPLVARAQHSLTKDASYPCRIPLLPFSGASLMAVWHCSFSPLRSRPEPHPLVWESSLAFPGPSLSVSCVLWAPCSPAVCAWLPSQ